MTSRDGRDLAPQPPPPPTPPPVEIQIGWDLEEIYCAHVEPAVAIFQGLPRLEVDRLRDMGGWAADWLRENGMDPALADRLEDALAALPSQDDFRRTSGSEWLAARRRWHEDLEHLLVTARSVVGVRAVRYFDYGVMLSRIQMCVRTVRVVANLPASLTTAFADALGNYRGELLRTTRQLAAFVMAEGPAGPRDPSQLDLERRFRDFAAYLQDWGTRNGELDEEFQHRLRDITYVSGFWTGDQIRQDMIWDLNPEIVPEAVRPVLPVPHTAEDRTALEARWTRAKQLADGDDVARSRELWELLDRCRHVLGPADPLTLRVHIDVAASMVPGRAEIATVMMLDVVNTTLHYYGPYHPTRYRLIRYAHEYFEEWDSEYARELYELPLKSLVERDETQLPTALHEVRRALRGELGMETT